MADQPRPAPITASNRQETPSAQTLDGDPTSRPITGAISAVKVAARIKRAWTPSPGVDRTGADQQSPETRARTRAQRPPCPSSQVIASSPIGTAGVLVEIRLQISNFQISEREYDC